MAENTDLALELSFSEQFVNAGWRKEVNVQQQQTCFRHFILSKVIKVRETGTLGAFSDVTGDSSDSDSNVPFVSASVPVELSSNEADAASAGLLTAAFQRFRALEDVHKKQSLAEATIKWGNIKTLCQVTAQEDTKLRAGNWIVLDLAGLHWFILYLPKKIYVNGFINNK